MKSRCEVKGERNEKQRRLLEVLLCSKSRRNQFDARKRLISKADTRSWYSVNEYPAKPLKQTGCALQYCSPIL